MRTGVLRRTRHVGGDQVARTRTTTSTSSRWRSTSARSARTSSSCGRRRSSIGAVESVVKDVREEYVEEFLSKALKANALYENKYPLVSAMSPADHRQAPRRGGPPRAAPSTSRTAAPARATTRSASRSGIAALDPDIEVLAPVREWELKTREQEMDYAERARHPRAHDQGQPVLDRRQPLGPRHRVRRARGPVGRAAGGHLHADRRLARQHVRRARVRRDQLRAGPAGRARRRAHELPRRSSTR